MEQICCIIPCFNNHLKLGQNAVNSFKNWNPAVPVFILTKEIIKSLTNTPNAGINNYIAAFKFAKNKGFNRFIYLGADTITCAPLDEFIIYNTKYDIVASLDYNYQLDLSQWGGIKTPLKEEEHTHVNADVCCFNNLAIFKEFLFLSQRIISPYQEQGILNQLIHSNNGISSKIIDHPYKTSSFTYSNRLKGNTVAGPGEKPWKKDINNFKVINNKLFNHEGKQIKVYHYGEGFYTRSESELNSLISEIHCEWFNEQTKQFFKEHCKIKNYF